MAKQMKFASAMMDFFGRHPGQTLSQFMEELRALSDAERAWFKANLAKVGYEIVA